MGPGFESAVSCSPLLEEAARLEKKPHSGSDSVLLTVPGDYQWPGLWTGLAVWELEGSTNIFIGCTRNWVVKVIVVQTEHTASVCPGVWASVAFLGSINKEHRACCNLCCWYRVSSYSLVRFLDMFPFRAGCLLSGARPALSLVGSSLPRMLRSSPWNWPMVLRTTMVR